jgi:beta-phosphoglucomutase-like phosphatase (HAD superfamily)
MPFDLLMLDFDGVVADSELLACTIAAAYISELGLPLTPRQAIRRFIGKRIREVHQLVEQELGSRIDDFSSVLQERTLAGFREALKPIPGVVDFLRARPEARCIASSSSHARLNACLAILAMADDFRQRVFSADDVSRGKPSRIYFFLRRNPAA